MIYKWFAYFFNTGIMISVVIALVLSVRAFMGRFPKKYSYMLWAVVLLRILCPLEITSSVSVFNLLGGSWDIVKVYEQGAEGTSASPNQEEQPGGSPLTENQAVPPAEPPAHVPAADLAHDQVAAASDTNTQAMQNAGILHESATGKKTDAAWQERSEQSNDDSKEWDGVERNSAERNKREYGELPAAQVSRFVTYGAFVWACGVLGLFVWNVLLLIFMKRKVRTSILLRDDIYECSGIPSPFVMGFVRPRIYIPFRLSEEEQDYIIKHEKHHIARKDNFIKLIALGVLCLYWFCPMFWIAWFFMNRDMEMSCDEYVLRRSSKDIRADYSRSLLGFAVNQRNMGIGMTSFGESDARRRVKHIMALKNYKKWIGGAAVVLIVAVGVICLTNAKPNEGKVEKDMVQEAVEDEVQEGKTKSGKELLTGEYGIAAETTVYDYRVEVQCFPKEEDENYLSGDCLMIQTSRGDEVIDIYEVDFELGGTFYFPKDGFRIMLADYDGDGERNDFALGQGQAKEPMAGNFMKYRFFGVDQDGMITGYHLSGEDDLCIGTLPSDEYSPLFQRKNGEIQYEGLSKSGVKKKKVSIIKYLTVAEAEAAKQKVVCPRMDQIRTNMPAEVVRELEQHGVWRISYGETPEQRDCNLGNAERADEITLRLDFHYEGDRLTKYVSKDYGFTDTVEAAEGDGKQTAFQFSWDFTQFVGKEDDMMTEAELPKKWEGEAYTYYEDMRGATYRIDSRINMVVEYEDPGEYISKLDVDRFPQMYGIHVSLPSEPVRILSSEVENEYREYVYNNQLLKQSVHLRCSKSENALEQTLARKSGSREHWSYFVDGKEKKITVEAYENKKGTAYAVCHWKEKEVHFWLYTKIKGAYNKTSLLATDYIILAKEAAEIAESVRKL